VDGFADLVSIYDLEKVAVDYFVVGGVDNFVDDFRFRRAAETRGWRA
jgi:hypothetical protein